MGGKGYGWHRDVSNSEIDILTAGTIIFTASSTAVTIPAGATSGLTVVAGGATITAGGLAITAGGLDIVSPLTLFGYATGAGGAATQADNKQTGVTVSKPCGTVTTHNQALGAGAESTFTVTNTLVAVGDVVTCSIVSGGTTGEYLAWCSAVAAGSFDITIANQSGSSASDAVLINFAVISGVEA